MDQSQLTTATWILAAVTGVYAVTTWLTLLEARSGRLSADVRAYPRPSSQHPLVVELLVENFGPAIALDLDFKFHFMHQGMKVSGSEEDGVRRPALAKGEHAIFMPYATATDDVGKSIQEWAARDYVLQLEWSWRDGLRNRNLVGPRTHRRVISIGMSDFFRRNYMGTTLLEPNPVADGLSELRKEMVKTREAIVRAMSAVDLER